MILSILEKEFTPNKPFLKLFKMYPRHRKTDISDIHEKFYFPLEKWETVEVVVSSSFTMVVVVVVCWGGGGVTGVENEALRIWDDQFYPIPSSTTKLLRIPTATKVKDFIFWGCPQPPLFHCVRRVLSLNGSTWLYIVKKACVSFDNFWELVFHWILWIYESSCFIGLPVIALQNKAFIVDKFCR